MQYFRIALVVLAAVAGSLAQDDNPYGCKRQTGLPICTMEYMPMCSSDGVTSGNHCDFCLHYFSQKDNGLDITLSHHGKCTLDDVCTPMSKKGFCPRIYRPICADGKTYSNECERCADLAAREEGGEDVYWSPSTPGRCEEHSVQKRAADFCVPRFFTGVCTREYFPVCGSDGQTYGNKCEFCYYQHLKEQNGEEMHAVEFGECHTNVVEDEAGVDCSQFDPRSNICTLEYFPICGTDGKIYGNKCFFCAAKRQKSGLGFAHYGQCDL